MVTLTKEEVETIINVLGEFPAKITYNCIKLLDAKLNENANTPTPTNIKPSADKR